MINETAQDRLMWGKQHKRHKPEARTHAVHSLKPEVRSWESGHSTARPGLRLQLQFWVCTAPRHPIG